jgi:hypothetical protein
MEQIRHPKSAPGDFYVANNVCIACGIPHVVAPDLVGWVDESEQHCYWKKQPENEYELNQPFAIFDSQEAGCHRYAGSDPRIQQRVGIENCDQPTSLLTNIRRWGPIWEKLPSTSTSLNNETITPSFLRRFWSKLFRS